MSDITKATNTEKEVTTTGTEEETGTEETIGEDESCTGATEKQILVATYPILFESHQYKPGDKLPTHNLEMNEAWLEAGTAFWISEDKKATKAVPASAQAGLAGTSIPASEEALIGRVPTSGTRAKGKKK